MDVENAKAFSNIALRLPSIAVGAVYGILYWVSPPQLTDVVVAARTEGSLLQWIAFLAPVVLTALLQLAAIGMRGQTHRVVDAFIVNMPMIALGAIIGRSAPETMWFMVPACLGVWVLCGSFGHPDIYGKS
ncbi:hypothetical protein [Mesorhizobium sp. M0276]|uniref:hypothetical protein n=1 Tax=Mesorhizobium sp. M0276 TaxID=2956928 RepID=UPI003334DF27